jgi:hypothetical protein
VAKALAGDPWDRYQSAEEMATALRQRLHAAQQVQLASDVAARPPASGRGRFWVLAAFILVTIVVGLGWGIAGLLEHLGGGITPDREVEDSFSIPSPTPTVTEPPLPEPAATADPMMEGKIAFGSYFTENGPIVLMSLDASQQVDLTDGTEPNVTPSWSPDGRRIAWARSGNVNSPWEGRQGAANG